MIGICRLSKNRQRVRFVVCGSWARCALPTLAGMKTEAEIRMKGMQALISALGLVEAERFLAAVSRDKFDYTEWRRIGLPDMTIEEIAAAKSGLRTED